MTGDGKLAALDRKCVDVVDAMYLPRTPACRFFVTSWKRIIT
jgi:hypothetical protein